MRACVGACAFVCACVRVCVKHLGRGYLDQWTRSCTYSRYHSVHQSALKVGEDMGWDEGNSGVTIQICMLGATFDVVREVCENLGRHFGHRFSKGKSCVIE